MKAKTITETIMRERDKLILSMLPLGYVQTIPVFSIKENGDLCLKVPFLKYRVTGIVDKTEVYPVKYLVTRLFPERTLLSCEDLAKNVAFSQVDFSHPIGYFRHEAAQKLDAQAYNKAQQELYTLYDALGDSLIKGIYSPVEKEKRLKELLKVLVAPYLHRFYKAIDKNFYEKYIR
mgnify:FL=1